MCTVTFLPQENQGFILTSNRDELVSRKTLPPKVYSENNVEMLYPKDIAAGGTWIGVSDKNRLICVLNGGFERHIRQVPYGKSRGVISKELLQVDAIESAVEALELNDVEPFTMVIIDWNAANYALFELVWDGTEKHFQELDKSPNIWSSSTLYTKENANMRAGWFYDWLKEKDFSQHNILNFHHSEKGDKEQAILMKRSYIETVSISSIQKNNEGLEFDYEDLLKNKHFRTSFNFQRR